MSFGGGGYQLYVGGAFVPQIVSTSYMLIDGPGTRTSARRNTRPSAKHSTTRSAMMCR